MTPFGDVAMQERVANGALALIEPGDDPRDGPWAARALGRHAWSSWRPAPR
jgi:hypothetical protein